MKNLMWSSRIIIVCLTCTLLACDDLDDRPIDNKRMAQAVKDRKPQRITEKDLLEWTKRKATAWTTAAQPMLYRQIKRGLADSTLKNIQDFDKLAPLPAVDSMIQQYEMDMQVYHIRKTYNLPTEAQKILGAYKQQNTSQEAVIKLSKTDTLYFATPIIIDNQTIGMWLITLPAKTARRWFNPKEIRN